MLVAALIGGATASAYNRNDVFEQLDRVPDDWVENTGSVYIGDDELDPGVRIGDSLILTAKASLPAHFTLVLVDSKGEVAVIAPAPASGSRSQAARELSYPPTGMGSLVESGPVGMQTVYVFATEQPVPLSVLGIPDNDDFAAPGRDPEAVSALVEALSDDAITGRRSVERYRYLVDSDVELGSRAVRRELALRVQQVDVLDAEANTRDQPAEGGRTAQVMSEPLAVSDVRFESGSARLTPTGRVQLDVIGSELLRRTESGGVPGIALEGHTDDLGDAEYNRVLSIRRAEAARRYLVESYGLAPGDIAVAGQGEASPRVPNSDAAARSMNRRVEIRVVR